MPRPASRDSAHSPVGEESGSTSNHVAWHTLPVSEVCQQQKSDLQTGLTADEAARRLSQQGPNVLAPVHQRSTLSIFIAQFHSLIVVLLVTAMMIAFVSGDRLEGFTILIVILINAAIGFFTEWNAEQALSALQKQSVRVAQVIRSGTEREIPAADIVPGDLIILAAGARVPADGRIVECVRLQIEESALTGESNAVTKTTDPLDDKRTALGDRFNMSFMGTTITDGRGRLLVTATGAQTEVGRIGTLIDEATTRDTPLEQKLARLGRMLIVITLVLCAIIVLAGWLRGIGDFWPMLEIGLSLAIAAVPEGLPAVATMTLALGMQRMARLRTLVRRLPAVETLGSTTVICTDKTGTLTRNEMTACVYILDERRIEVTGTGYERNGSFHSGDQNVDVRSDHHLAMALRIGMLCNDAKIERTDGKNTVLGDPTEAALIVAAEKASLSLAELSSEFPRLSEVPFDSASKRMVTVHKSPQGSVLAFVKGAPGTVIAASQSQLRGTDTLSLTEEDRQRWNETNDELAGASLRVLGLAYRELPADYSEADLSRDLILVGLVGMSDPLRDEAKSAIAICREAGIRTVMITGDQQKTAAEIARQLGIDRDLHGRALRTVHGSELTGLDAEGWKRAVADAAVFARVSPEYKLQIVEALQEQGHIVAMTGDGVNDAPALKKADIGIAMGIKGTEVAKENADMVITDDNFASIVSAVEQGRIIYGNILKFLHYLLSCNFSEILTVFVALMMGWSLPLAALQILWLNLVTDVFPAFALALEPSAPDVMKRLPRDPGESLLTSQFIGLIAWQGLLLTGVTLLAFAVGMNWYGTEGEGQRRATTIAFMTLALAQVFHTLNARSQSESAFTRRIFANLWLWGAVLMCLLLQVAAVTVPILQRILRTVTPSSSDWAIILMCSLSPIAAVELVKWTQRMAAQRRTLLTGRS